MASTFVISATTATFTARIRGSQQTAGDLEQLSLSVLMPDATEWANLQSLVTTKYHVHAPLSGDPIVDVAIGPGEGTLTIPNLGTVAAILTGLRRTNYLPSAKSEGQADFLITGTWA